MTDLTSTPDQIGYGQMGPADQAHDFNRITFLVRQLVARMDTMKLVQVVKVTGSSNTPGAGTGTVDVLPLVNQVDGIGNAVKHQTIFGLPWSRLQGGANAVICDPVAGDVGYVIASDRDIGLIQSQTPGSITQANPGTFRRFDIADGIYVGGCLNITPTQYLIFRTDGIRIVDKNGNSVIMSSGGLELKDQAGNDIKTTSTGITITDKNGSVIKSVSGGFEIDGNLKVVGTLEATGVETGDAGLNVTGNITATGSITAGQGGADQVGLQTHTHTQGVDSHGDVEQPTASPTAGT